MNVSIEEFYTTTIERLKTSDGWWQIKCNHDSEKVDSCMKAVRFRDRLGAGGNGGVPLWTELKSQIIKLINRDDNTSKFIVSHTRANTRFQDDKLLQSLGFNLTKYNITKILDEENEDQKNKKQKDSPLFGLVNPLNVDKLLQSQGININSSSIVQVFDEALFLHGGFPDTITTNAGKRSEFIETTSKNLMNCVKRYFDNVTLKSRCSIPCPIWTGKEAKYDKKEWKRFPPASGPKIGLLTGNSPESGLTLWNDFLDQYRSYYNNLADVLMPEMVIYSLPQMGLSMELVKRENEVWKEMKAAIELLLNANCKIITIACNTTIYFGPRINEMCKAYNAKFVSIAEACLPKIQKELAKQDDNSSSVGLFGIGPVIDIEGGYSGYAKHFKDNGIGVVPCDSTDLAWDIKSVGTSDNKDEIQSLIEKFRTMTRGLTGVKIVVLALTEISLIYRKHIAKLPKKYKSQKIIIDPLFELSRYLVFTYLLQGFRENRVYQLSDEFFPLESNLKEMIYGD